MYTLSMDEADFRKKLTPEQYNTMREKGTERPFAGRYWNEHGKGMYKCAACGAELFSSEAKFDSGTGWPSFTEPANLKNIELKEDMSHGPPSPDGFGRASMRRTEVLCKKCGSHLGHVFDDLPRLPRGKAGGPPAGGGKRYCINSCSLELEKAEKVEPK